MAYAVQLTQAAQRDLDRVRLARGGDLVRDDLRSLADNPRPAGAKKTKPPGNMHEFRSGRHRIIYVVSDLDQVVEIRRVCNRRDLDAAVRGL